MNSHFPGIAFCFFFFFFFKLGNFVEFHWVLLWLCFISTVEILLLLENEKYMSALLFPFRFGDQEVIFRK